MTVAPDSSGAGVMVSVRLVPAPLMTRPLPGTSAGLEEEAARLRLAAGVSTSDTAKLIPLTVSSLMLRSAMTDSTGGSLTGRTVTMNVDAAVSPAASRTVTVIRAEPF